MRTGAQEIKTWFNFCSCDNLKSLLSLMILKVLYILG